MLYGGLVVELGFVLVLWDFSIGVRGIVLWSFYCYVVVFREVYTGV